MHPSSTTEPPTTENLLLGGRVRLLQPQRGYRVAVDAVLLAAAVPAVAGQRVLDLGAGVGAVGLCLATRVADVEIAAVELQPFLVGLGRRSADLNGLGGRLGFVQHDIARPLPEALGRFEQVATNPPYLPAAVADPSPDMIKALATVESSADLARWLAVATAALAPDGTLSLIHRRDRLEEIVGHLDGLGWGDLLTKPLAPINRVLVRARRGSPARHDAAPLVLHRPDGHYTDAAEAILRHAEPLAF